MEPRLGFFFLLDLALAASSSGAAAGASGSSIGGASGSLAAAAIASSKVSTSTLAIVAFGGRRGIGAAERAARVAAPLGAALCGCSCGRGGGTPHACFGLPTPLTPRGASRSCFWRRTIASLCASFSVACSFSAASAAAIEPCWSRLLVCSCHAARVVNIRPVSGQTRHTHGLGAAATTSSSSCCPAARFFCASAEAARTRGEGTAGLGQRRAAATAWRAAALSRAATSSGTPARMRSAAPQRESVAIVRISSRSSAGATCSKRPHEHAARGRPGGCGTNDAHDGLLSRRSSATSSPSIAALHAASRPDGSGRRRTPVVSRARSAWACACACAAAIRWVAPPTETPAAAAHWRGSSSATADRSCIS